MGLAVIACLTESLHRENCGSGGFIIGFCNKTLLVCVEQGKAKEIHCPFGVCDTLNFLGKFIFPFLDQELKVVFATRISFFCVKFLHVRGLKTSLVPSDH